MTAVDTTSRTTSNSEGALELTRSATGNHDAFDQLYRMFASRVHGLARILVRDATLAEDVTQEVFSELWRKADRFDPAKGSATAWIMTLTRSRAIDRIRGTEQSRSRDNNWASVQGSRDTDTVVESVMTSLDHQQVRDLLAILTDVQHQAIVLTYFDGLTSAQIGRMLGIPRNTVKTRTRDALLRIRGHLVVAERTPVTTGQPAIATKTIGYPRISAIPRRQNRTDDRSPRTARQREISGSPA